MVHSVLYVFDADTIEGTRNFNLSNRMQNTHFRYVEIIIPSFVSAPNSNHFTLFRIGKDVMIHGVICVFAGKHPISRIVCKFPHVLAFVYVRVSSE